MTLWQTPESRTFFGTHFRVPDSHTIWRNQTRSADDGENAPKATSEIEPYIEGTSHRGVANGRRCAVTDDLCRQFGGERFFKKRIQGIARNTYQFSVASLSCWLTRVKFNI